MNKQRKIISVLLALVMIMATGFIMSGCGDEDPVELFKKASDNMSKANTLSFDGSMSMNMKVDKQEVKMSFDMDGQYIKSESDDPMDMQMAMNISMNVMGQKTEMKMYVKDGYSYSDDGTNKTKIKLQTDSADRIKKLMETKLEMDKYVKESSIDGDVVKLTLDGKKLMKDAMDKYKDSVGNDSGNATVDTYSEMFEKAGLDEITVEATIKDENFTAFKMSMPMKMDVGTGSKVDADVAIDFSKIEVNPDLKEIEIPDQASFK